MSHNAIINLTFLAGMALLSTGLWLLAPWVCLTVIGMLLVGLSILGRLSGDADQPDQSES